MNRLSKAYQLRPKVSEPKPEKPRAFNSTLAAGKGLSPIGKRGRKLRAMDSVCADEVLSRDGYECIACLWLDGKRTAATVVHHIARKNTHRGVEVRFRLGYQVALCEACHRDDHDGRLHIDAEPTDRGVEQQYSRGDKHAGRTVSDWNPFDTEA